MPYTNAPGRWDRLRRRPSVLAAVAVIIALGTYGLIGKAVHYASLLRAVEKVRLWWLPALLGGQAIGYGGYVLAYRGLARLADGPALPVPVAVRVVAAGAAAFVLGSSVGGLAVDYWALHRAGDNPDNAAQRVLGLNIMKWVWMGGAACVVSLALLSGAGPGAPVAMALSWAIVVPVCLAGGWALSSRSSFGRRRLPADPPEGASLPARAAHLARRGLADSGGALCLVRIALRHPWRNRGACFGFAFYWLGDAATLMCALAAFSVAVHPLTFFLAYATAYTATALPLPVGGAGGIDAAMAFSLRAVGAPLGGALLGVALYRVFSFWLPVVPGVVSASTISGLERQLDQLAERAA